MLYSHSHDVCGMGCPYKLVSQVLFCKVCEPSPLYKRHENTSIHTCIHILGSVITTMAFPCSEGDLQNPATTCNHTSATNVYMSQNENIG